MIPKLRVWDTVKKAMHEVQAIVYTEQEVYPIYSKTIRRYIPFAEAILMQSTGLKDRNGIEIFEGDVVSLNGSLYTVAYDKENGAYKMISHDERWIDDYILSYITTESLTVVGNKFEGLKE